MFLGHIMIKQTAFPSVRKGKKAEEEWLVIIIGNLNLKGSYFPPPPYMVEHMLISI